MARSRSDRKIPALGVENDGTLQIEATRLIERMVAADAKQLGRKVLQLAMADSERCLLFCLERIAPKRRPMAFKLPSIKNSHDIPDAMAAITTAVNDRRLTCEDAAHLARLLESFASAIHTHDLVVRLEALEAEIWEATP
jgi:hypothetical protein